VTWSSTSPTPRSPILRRSEPAPPDSRRLIAEVPSPARHLDFAASHFADPDVAGWHWPGSLGGPRTRGQALEMLERGLEGQRADGYTLWWWRERGSGEVIGMIGLRSVTIESAERVEVGWSVAPRRWGEGLAAEAAAASIRWGFETAGLEQVISYTMSGNTRSRRVMDKLGMRFSHEFVHVGLPHVLYAADRGRWPGSSTLGAEC